jgi:uncharacterized protein (DUF4415 family)
MTKRKQLEKLRIVTDAELDSFDLNSVDWARVDAITDEEIDAQIASDPDVAPIADEAFFERAVLVYPEVKTPISLRVDSDVLRGFRESGTGYQARMNEALRSYAVEHGWIGAKPDRPAARRGRPTKQAK